jgi:hypothetical protein
LYWSQHFFYFFLFFFLSHKTEGGGSREDNKTFFMSSSELHKRSAKQIKLSFDYHFITSTLETLAENCHKMFSSESSAFSSECVPPNWALWLFFDPFMTNSTSLSLQLNAGELTIRTKKQKESKKERERETDWHS